jgi:hypothetical protein
VVKEVIVHVSAHTYQKLRKLAVLAGSESAAIDRLVTHWEAYSTSPSDEAGSEVESRATWRSPTGDVLRIGERLEARDGGKSHFAIVEQSGIRFDQKLFDSPSAAARAVKEKRGLTGPATSTNGRDFWKVRDPGSGRLVSLRDMRPHRGVDVSALLAELDTL